MSLWLAGLLLSVAFVTDITKHKIPNWLTLAGTGGGIIYHLTADSWNGLLFAGLGFLSGFVPMVALYALRAVAAGDVKLFAALGSLVGAIHVLYVMSASLLIAGCIAVFILLWRSDGLQRLKNTAVTLLRVVVFRDLTPLVWVSVPSDRLRFPFMWAVAPGAAYTFILW
ncbi:prepilin peptidase CpaA [Paenibacillus sp. PvP052]|nr:prepilin peptidase CpaA [Paenibacillus sp. PvP052]